jgi:hypothetical protein
VPNKPSLALLFRQFDDRKSNRSPSDVASAYQGLYEELHDVPKGPAKLAVEGACWYDRYVEGLPAPTADDQYIRFGEPGLLEFIRWLFGLLTSSAEAQYTDDGFCDAMKEWSDKLNKDAGSMLDSITRSDGVAVLCATKIVDFKKFIKIDESAMRDDWFQRKQQQWNDIYCKDDIWSQAIAAGWTVAQTWVFANGKRYWMKAECR